jgi:type II secretory pathway component PulJ
MSRGQRRTQTDDSGFTLVELMIYSLLMIVVMTIAAALFIRILETQQEVRSIADQNNDIQLTFSELERDVRNAWWASVDYTGDLLIIESRSTSAAGDGQLACVAYYFDEPSGELRRTSLIGNSAETAAAWAAPNRAALQAISSNWKIVRDDMARVDGNVVFGPIDKEFRSPESVTMQLAGLTDNDHKPVELSKTISLRPQGGESIGCRS